MDDAFVVGGLKRQAKQPRNRHRAINGQPSLRGHEAVEILAIHISHRDELQTAHIAQIVNAQNVFVRYLTGQQQLLLQPLHGAGAELAAGRQIGSHFEYGLRRDHRRLHRRRLQR